MAEFPATGGILTSWQFYSVKLLTYVSYYDYFIAACEIIFLILFIVFITQEGKNIKEFKSAYFKSISNWLELLLLVVSMCSPVWVKGLTYEPINKRYKSFYSSGLILKAASISPKMNCIVHINGGPLKGRGLFLFPGLVHGMTSMT